MNLMTLAKADNAVILEDVNSGFGVPITLLWADLTTVTVNGQWLRVGVTIDQDTGLLVAGSRLTATVRLSSLPKDPQEGMTVTGPDGSARVAMSGLMFDRSADRVTMQLKAA